MNLSIEKIGTLCPDWNRRQLTENDFYDFCDCQDILVIETPLRYRINAMLWFVENQYVATINSRLHGITRLFSMWHEVGHFLMHSPSRTVGTYFWGDEKIYSHQNRREENQADAFALCCLIPKPWISRKTFNDLLDEGFTEKQVWKRKEIFEKHQQ